MMTAEEPLTLEAIEENYNSKDITVSVLGEETTFTVFYEGEFKREDYEHSVGMGILRDLAGLGYIIDPRHSRLFGYGTFEGWEKYCD